VSTSKATMRAGHEPLMPGVLVVPYPRTELSRTLAAIDELFMLQALPERVAAFVVEPVLGEGGYVVPPDGFLPALSELCDQHGILLVADEVQSGFGRSGRMWAVEHTGVAPDVITAAKGIASGLPMGALIARGELLDAWPAGGHGNTYGGNPLAIAAANATLDVLEDELLAENATLRGEELLAGLRDEAARLPGTVVGVRGRGLMVALELHSGAIAQRACDALLARNVICGTCGPDFETLRFAPPLTIDTSAIARVVKAVSGALAELAEQ
jgi:4-aminobutyrate aminotransferase